MKIQELSALSKDELQVKLKSLKEELTKINLERYAGRVEKPHMFAQIKKNIARVLTLLNTKKDK